MRLERGEALSCPGDVRLVVLRGCSQFASGFTT